MSRCSAVARRLGRQLGYPVYTATRLPSPCLHPPIHTLPCRPRSSSLPPECSGNHMSPVPKSHVTCTPSFLRPPPFLARPPHPGERNVISHAVHVAPRATEVHLHVNHEDGLGGRGGEGSGGEGSGGEGERGVRRGWMRSDRAWSWWWWATGDLKTTVGQGTRQMRNRRARNRRN